METKLSTLIASRMWDALVDHGLSFIYAPPEVVNRMKTTAIEILMDMNIDSDQTLSEFNNSKRNITELNKY